MKTIKITYEHKSANGFPIKREYTTNNGKDYERIVNIIHQNKDEYKVLKVEHV